LALAALKPGAPLPPAETLAEALVRLSAGISDSEDAYRACERLLMLLGDALSAPALRSVLADLPDPLRRSAERTVWRVNYEGAPTPESRWMRMADAPCVPAATSPWLCREILRLATEDMMPTPPMCDRIWAARQVSLSAKCMLVRHAPPSSVKGEACEALIEQARSADETEGQSGVAINQHRFWAEFLCRASTSSDLRERAIDLVAKALRDARTDEEVRVLLEPWLVWFRASGGESGDE